MNKFFYNIAIAIPLRQTFTYHSNHKIKPGIRVKVKFGTRVKLGIIMEVIEKTEIKTKSILQVIDDYPAYSNVELNILRWAANYYHHPIGEVVISFLPSHLRQVKTTIEKKIKPLKEESTSYSFEKKLTKQQYKAVKELS